jgi:hypothetical protein
MKKRTVLYKKEAKPPQSIEATSETTKAELVTSIG